jgi:O-antigen/teichoic acid export membrane protein
LVDGSRRRAEVHLVTALASAVSLRTHVRAGARFIASFGAAKGVALIGPLILARLLTAQDYGAVELALSVGLLGGVVGSLGIPLAVPQLYLALARRHVEDLLGFQTLVVAVAAAGSALILWHMRAPSALQLSAIMVGLFAAQIALSSYCRVRQARTWSGWVDNLCLVLLAVLSLGWYAATGGLDLRHLSVGFQATLLLVMVGALAVFLGFRRPRFGPAYRDAIGRGSVMMINALLMFFTTSSLRLFIGHYLSLEDVALYSLCARICLALVFIHQLVVTGLFAQIYTLSDARFDRYFSACLGGLLGFGIALNTGFSWFADRWHWGSLDMATLHGLFPIVCAQTVLWIATAWFEMLIVREGLAATSATVMALLFSTFVAVVAVLDVAGWLGLITINLVFGSVLFVSVLCQIQLLARQGLRFPRFQWTLSLVPVLALQGAL